MTEFHPRDRVRGKVSGKVGTVVPREASAHYVWVNWDGNPYGCNPVEVGTDKLELIHRPEVEEAFQRFVTKHAEALDAIEKYYAYPKHEVITSQEPTGATVPGLGIGMCTGGYECPAEEHYEGCFNGPCNDECPEDCNGPEPTGVQFGRAVADAVAPAMSQVGNQFPPTPATDPIGTVRVHPGDDPEDPNARRGIKTEDVPWWAGVTGVDDFVHDEEIADWNRQSLTDVARVLGHPDKRRDGRISDRADDAERERDAAIDRAEKAEGSYYKLTTHILELERQRDEIEERWYIARNENSARRVEIDVHKARAERLERELEEAVRDRDTEYQHAENLEARLGVVERERARLVESLAVRRDAQQAAETRAASWWEASKQYCRAMNTWVDISIEDQGKIMELRLELNELKKALRTLSGE